MKISSILKKQNNSISQVNNEDIEAKTNENSKHGQEPISAVKNDSSTQKLNERTAIQQRLVDDLVRERDEYKQKYLELSNAIQTQTDFSKELNDASLDVLKYWEECRQIYNDGLKEISVLKSKYTSMCQEMAQMKADYKREMDKLLKQAQEDLIEE